ncbi:MAG: hypothetical protein KAH18_06815 [Psychromonas sp.]|nr:hypothetical protein [Psychromonas sp.]
MVTTNEDPLIPVTASKMDAPKNIPCTCRVKLCNGVAVEFHDMELDLLFQKLNQLLSVHPDQLKKFTYTGNSLILIKRIIVFQ